MGRQETMEPTASPAQQRDETVDRLRRELRRLVRESDETQRSIEMANGFTRGYLSQVLHGNVTLTARHVFGILFALAVQPGPFFSHFFGGRPPAADASLSEIRERMSRYDAALKELEDKGILAPDRKEDA